MRVLGSAFLLQFITSLISGTVLRQMWHVPGDISKSMIKIADHAGWMRANIFVDMLTAMGIIFLGVALFVTLRKHGETIALVALSFYLLEAALLATSRLATFSLLRVSQDYMATGHPTDLEMIASLAFESMEFVGGTLHMLVFCLGAMLFYYLLYQSDVVPRALSLWGLVTIPLLLILTVVAVFGYDLPLFLYFPYVPFELVIGIWSLVKGMRKERAR